MSIRGNTFAPLPSLPRLPRALRRTILVAGFTCAFAWLAAACYAVATSRAGIPLATFALLGALLPNDTLAGAGLRVSTTARGILLLLALVVTALHYVA